MAIAPLSEFFKKIRDDNRITATHISVYMALFELWNINNFINPVSFRRRDVMIAAKINELATYHKCMKDLNDFGYVRYVPSYNSLIENQAFLL